MKEMFEYSQINSKKLNSVKNCYSIMSDLHGSITREAKHLEKVSEDLGE